MDLRFLFFPPKSPELRYGAAPHRFRRTMRGVVVPRGEGEIGYWIFASLGMNSLIHVLSWQKKNDLGTAQPPTHKRLPTLYLYENYKPLTFQSAHVSSLL